MNINPHESGRLEVLRRLASVGALTEAEREDAREEAAFCEEYAAQCEKHAMPAGTATWSRRAEPHRALLALDDAAKAREARRTERAAKGFEALRRALGRPHERFAAAGGSEYGCRFCGAPREETPEAITHTPDCSVTVLRELESEVRDGA